MKRIRLFDKPDTRILQKENELLKNTIDRQQELLAKFQQTLETYQTVYDNYIRLYDELIATVQDSENSS